MSTAWPPPPAEGSDATPPGYAWPPAAQQPPFPYGFPAAPLGPAPWPPAGQAPPPGAYPPAPYPPPYPSPYPPPYPQAYPMYAAPASTNGLAIAALVLGLVWIYWITSILAIVFGHIALSQIRQNGQRGRGLAIAGLVLGYVWVGLLVLVIVGTMVARTSMGAG